MGCFSGHKAQSFQVPKAPQYKQADELFQSAMDWAKANFPGALGAREGALSDLGRGTEYYEGFSPTSMEEALGNQYFQNIMPDIERSLKHNLSLSGMAYSPILSKQIAEQRGKVGFDVGSYLSNLGQERATYSLAQRLGIDPASVYGPHLETDVRQSGLQAEGDYDQALMQAQVNYNDELRRAQEGQSKRQMWMDLASPALAMIPGVGPALSAGAKMGSSYYGGSQGGQGFGDILQMISQMQKPQPVFQGNTTPSGYGGGVTIPGYGSYGGSSGGVGGGVSGGGGVLPV